MQRHENERRERKLHVLFSFSFFSLLPFLNRLINQVRQLITMAIDCPFFLLLLLLHSLLDLLPFLLIFIFSYLSNYSFNLHFTSIRLSLLYFFSSLSLTFFSSSSSLLPSLIGSFYLSSFSSPALSSPS